MLPSVGNERQHAPHRIQQNPNYNPQNMAYVNISSDGAKAVGPIGLKRAEKELIMRRYKNPHYQNDSINRVALIYGQQNQHANSYDRQYVGNNDPMGGPQMMPGNSGGSGQGRGYHGGGINMGNGSYQSPYLVSVNGDGLGGNSRHGNNAINIIRRSNKNYLDELKNQNSGYQVRLPKITNLNIQNH